VKNPVTATTPTDKTGARVSVGWVILAEDAAPVASPHRSRHRQGGREHGRTHPDRLWSIARPGV